ncbi:MAG TPA: 30S ribosomal protein S1 [Candidatus Pelagibacter sp.]|jgi:small subunit ribosomal protein S1|nr:30S ribosomal protein S1 [Candidatus Pelagibacter sp.]
MQEATKEDKSKTQKEFEQLLAQDLSGRKLVEGSIIKAKISSITKKHVLVDVAGKSESMIPIEEFQFSKELENLKVGSEVEVLLETLENKHGEIVVSRERAKRELSWKKMLSAFDQKTEVEGVIVGKVRGGFCVDTEGSLCFLPQSQVDIKPRRNFDDLYKIPQKFEIVKIDQRRKNIVLSRRAIIERKRNIDRDKIISKIKENDIIEGTIKNITSFGAFVDLNGIDSLLHINEISYSRIDKPADILAIGQTVKVKVIKIDEAKKISVSVKALSEDPYLKAVDSFKVGKKYTATISKVMDYGAFARLAEGLEGLIHQSECSWTKKNIYPGKILSTSQKVEVEVLEKDIEKRRISLSYKNCLLNPWDEFTKKYKVGDACTATLKNVTDYALFATIKDSELDGMCHFKNISYSEKESELEKYKKNQTLDFKILEINQEKEKIRLGIRELKSDPFEFFANRKEGDVVTVIVESSSQNGIYVYADNKDQLVLIKKNQLAKEPENCRPSRFVPKQKVDCCISELQKDNRKVSLSIKMMEEKEAAAAVKKYGSVYSGGRLSDILGPLLKKKKKTDKKK